MHPQALAFYRTQLADLPPLRVVEFGSCDMNGTVRAVYPQAADWFGIDLQPGRNVDLIADAATWTTDTPFDVCVIAEVFEHAPEWPALIASAHRALVNGGLLIASCATGNRPPHSAIDGGPLRQWEWYENVNPDAMRAALVGWSSWEVTEADGHFGGDDLYVRAVK